MLEHECIPLVSQEPGVPRPQTWNQSSTAAYGAKGGHALFAPINDWRAPRTAWDTGAHENTFGSGLNTSTDHHTVFPGSTQNLNLRRLPSHHSICCLLYTSPSPRDRQKSRMPSSA